MSFDWEGITFLMNI
jgi:hypothetical protein